MTGPLATDEAAKDAIAAVTAFLAGDFDAVAQVVNAAASRVQMLLWLLGLAGTLIDDLAAQAGRDPQGWWAERCATMPLNQR